MALISFLWRKYSPVRINIVATTVITMCSNIKTTCMWRMSRVSQLPTPSFGRIHEEPRREVVIVVQVDGDVSAASALDHQDDDPAAPHVDHELHVPQDDVALPLRLPLVA